MPNHKFPNYKDMFLNAMEHMMLFTKSDREALIGKAEFLKQYRTSKFNMGRQTGKTRSILEFADEISLNVCIIAMNDANAKWLKERLGVYSVCHTITIVSMNNWVDKLKSETPDINYDLILMDESEFCLKNKQSVEKFYEDCTKTSIKYIIMT